MGSEFKYIKCKQKLECAAKSIVLPICNLPVVTSITSPIPSGSEVVITGKFFIATGTTTVTVGGFIVPSTVTSTTITFILPIVLPPGPNTVTITTICGTTAVTIIVITD